VKHVTCLPIRRVQGVAAFQISCSFLESTSPSLHRDDFGLKGVNMGVDMGSRIAIVGPNGAGKVRNA
jgi:ABC-type polysaccharide/polyol phosphate transport system ATPase subunit